MCIRDRMWTLDHIRGFEIQSPLVNLRKMSPEERDKHVEEYRQGFTCKPI